MKKGRIYVLLAVLMVSAFAAAPAAVMAKESENTLNYGAGSLVVDLDPQQAWDSASIDVIDQVCEGLFGYNLSDPALAIVPNLAEDLGTWNADATEFTVNLKQGVVFHDGSDFTADDVKWTFDRLNGLIEDGLSQIAELYEPLNGELVIEEVEVVSDYVVTFHLAYPYVPFVPLLCFSGSYILSSESTPVDALLDVASDVLVGTGPYKYVEQTQEYCELQAFDDWHGTFPDMYLEKILIIYYADDPAKNQAFLSGDLDWVDGALPEYLDVFDLSEDHVVGEQRQGTTILYMGMNNKQINRTFRQAISWAFDYDYVIEELALGNAARLTTPVPEGIMYHNPDVDYPVYNLTVARQILIDAGIAPASAAAEIANDEWWTTLTTDDPIVTYNYTYNSGNEFRADLGTLTRNNLALIGIDVEIKGMEWSDYLDRLLGEFDKLQLYMIGWGADYNDPSNFINPLFSNTSASNGAQVNDDYLQTQMMAGLTETNATAREELYFDIQAYIVEDLMPWVFLYVPLSRGVRAINVDGIQRNPMGKVYFGSMHWTGLDPYVAPGIPGFTVFGLIGAAAITLTAIIKKRK